MASLLYPVNGFRGAQQAQGAKPKNHMRANLKDLKKKQEENKERAEAASQYKADPFKMTKFKNVESKLTRTGMKFDPNAQAPVEERQASRGGPKR